MSDDFSSSSSEEYYVDKLLSHKRNLMKFYDTSTELAYVVTPACGTACLAKGISNRRKNAVQCVQNDTLPKFTFPVCVLYV